MFKKNWLLHSMAIPLVMLFSTATFANPAETAVEKSKLDRDRKFLIGTYDALSSVPAEQWEEKLHEYADILENFDVKDGAQMLRDLSAPEYRESVLAELKEKIDNMSENGLGFIVMGIAWACSPALQYNGFPTGTAIALAIFGVFTLDGEVTSNH